jgi:hypothetical protein
MVTVRPATVADGGAIGRLHVRAWRAPYRGHMPDTYLAGLRAEERAGWTADGTERRDEVFGVTVAEVRYRRRWTSPEISSATPAGTV